MEKIAGVLKMRKRRCILWSAILLIGCANSWGDVDKSMAREFFRQPVLTQQKTFRARPLQDQLDLFFFGNQVRHPPAIYLAECFSLGGAPAVELLRAKLTKGVDDLGARDIAMLLATSDAMGQYDVKADVELLNMVQRRVAGISDLGWRDTAERKIASIGRESGKHPGYGSACN